MSLLISSPRNIESDLILLKEKLPDFIIKKSGKKRIFIINNKVLSIIRYKKSQTTIHGDINLKNTTNLILVSIGILIGILGLIIILPILYLDLNKKIKKLKLQVFNAIQN